MNEGVSSRVIGWEWDCGCWVKIRGWAGCGPRGVGWWRSVTEGGGGGGAVGENCGNR